MSPTLSSTKFWQDETDNLTDTQKTAVRCDTGCRFAFGFISSDGIALRVVQEVFDCFAAGTGRKCGVSGIQSRNFQHSKKRPCNGLAQQSNQNAASNCKYWGMTAKNDIEPCQSDVILVFISCSGLPRATTARTVRRGRCHAPAHPRRYQSRRCGAADRYSAG